MSSLQKVIKYVAMAFAIMLAIGIITGMANAAITVVSLVSGNIDSTNRSEQTVDVMTDFVGVKSLEINNSSGTFKILPGDTFRVEASNVSKDFQAKVNSNGVLIIDDDNDFIFFDININGFHHPNSKITLYLPDDFIAEKVQIDSGAGSVTIEELYTEYLHISAGAGNITGNNLSADEVKVDGGVGNIKLRDVRFEEADFNSGVGNLSIEGVLLGKTKIDCGVGEVELDLIGNINDYDIDVDSGVGTIRVNGEKLSDSDKIDNNADNSIKVDGGVGNVNIDLK